MDVMEIAERFANTQMTEIQLNYLLKTNNIAEDDLLQALMIIEFRETCAALKRLFFAVLFVVSIFYLLHIF